MAVANEMEVIWDELIDAFLNEDDQLVYFLDKATGEIFAVPEDYDDEAFWQQVEANPNQFIIVPGVDQEEERMLAYEFIRKLTDPDLKSLLEKTFAGKSSFGKIEEILSFYPDDLEFFYEMKDEMLNHRIRSWLEEHDIYPPSSLI